MYHRSRFYRRSTGNFIPEEKSTYAHIVQFTPRGDELRVRQLDGGWVDKSKVHQVLIGQSSIVSRR